MIIDLLIIILAATAVYLGRSSGLLRRVWSSVGFFVGLLIGRELQPHALNLVTGLEDRAVMTVIVLLGSAMIGLTIGEYLGSHFKRRLPGQQLNRLDNILGSVLGVAVILFSAWLLASLSRSLPYAGLQDAVSDSKIVSSLNRILPPAPKVIDNLGRLINPNGFPDVFIGNDPIPRGRVNLPGLGELTPAVNAAKDSVVRIKGQGCGGIVAGSGFVIDKNLVATNAHVVAGIDRPYIQDVSGSHQAQVIWFNSDLDFAVLRVTGLAGKPLAFRSDRAPGGTPAAVLGYPGGGDFTADPAAVLASFTARGRDIYDQKRVNRIIYELQADIEQGNSGGPLIDKEGRVIGIIFAESTSYEQVGYALVNDQVVSEIAAAKSRNQVTDTGLCTE